MVGDPERVADLAPRILKRQLSGPGLMLRTGAALIRIHSPIKQIADLIGLLYRDYPVPSGPLLPDAELRLLPSSGPRRLWHPQVHCLVDGRPPFEALPGRLAYPMLEWSMNWTVATRLHRYFMIHAAVVARDGRALILPAWSGSGKSTLCAALIQHGWRFLSDEFCLLHLDSGQIHALPRPIPLKNESLPAMRAFAPDAVMGPTFFQTRKGDIAHLRPPAASIAAAATPATPAWVVLPRYQADAGAQLEPIAPAQALQLMASNSFNFTLLGAPAFKALGRLTRRVGCHRIAYSDLGAAVAALDALSQ